ncbi:hypothetical protein A4R44_08787 [Amycolatopsis sp. M39]|nr:hypothetical protein A4R44_08787 [Amycolatopsis sp. M39]
MPMLTAVCSNARARTRPSGATTAWRPAASALCPQAKSAQAAMYSGTERATANNSRPATAATVAAASARRAPIRSSSVPNGTVVVRLVAAPSDSPSATIPAGRPTLVVKWTADTASTAPSPAEVRACAVASRRIAVRAVVMPG